MGHEIICPEFHTPGQLGWALAFGYRPAWPLGETPAVGLRCPHHVLPGEALVLACEGVDQRSGGGDNTQGPGHLLQV